MTELKLCPACALVLYPAVVRCDKCESLLCRHFITAVDGENGAGESHGTCYECLKPPRPKRDATSGMGLQELLSHVFGNSAFALETASSSLNGRAQRGDIDAIKDIAGVLASAVDAFKDKLGDLSGSLGTMYVVTQYDEPICALPSKELAVDLAEALTFKAKLESLVELLEPWGHVSEVDGETCTCSMDVLRAAWLEDQRKALRKWQPSKKNGGVRPEIPLPPPDIDLAPVPPRAECHVYEVPTHLPE